MINGASFAVLWVGAERIGNGDLQVGSLVAYLTYLIIILMSVVMATFTVSMMPRASVAAGRIPEVLDTPSSVVPPAIPVIPTAARSSVELRGVGFTDPCAEAPARPALPFPNHQ